MSQIENRTYDNIKQIFEEANIYLDAFFAGDKERTKDNLIIFNNDNISNITIKNNVCHKKQKEKIMTYKGKKLTKRTDGRWVYTFTKNHQRKYIYGRTQSECIKNTKIYENKLDNIQKSIDFNDIIDNWYKSTKEPNIKEKTKEIYKNTINNYIKPFLKSRNINNIKLHELQTFINNIEKERVREQVYQHVKSLFNYAYASREIKTNICNALLLPKRKHKEQRNALTIQEQTKLLNNIKNTNIETFVIFSIIIGTRRNETLSFKMSDIDKEKQTLRIHGTKTKSAERTIKISKEMIKYLEEHNTSEKYFPHTPEYYTKNIKKYLEVVNKNLCVHCLRHTCATNLYYLQVPDKMRQQILGHKSIVTTNNIYTNLELDATKDDILKLYNNLYYKY